MIRFDGIWDEPQIAGPPTISHDVAERPREMTSLRVPMMSTDLAYFLPASGTATSYAGITWYIVGDNGFSGPGGGVLAYTREWVRKPEAFDHFETFAANYPGLTFARDPQSLMVTSKVAVTFYLIQQGPGGDFFSAENIPIDDETRVEYSDGFTAPLLSNVFLNPSSTPSRGAYQAAIVAGSFSIVAEPTSLSQVRGPLWRAETRRVKPK